MGYLCGHHRDCVYRYMHKGKIMRFCMACVVEQFPDCHIDSEKFKKKHETKEEKEKKEMSEKEKPEKKSKNGAPQDMKDFENPDVKIAQLQTPD